ncbi:4a-hydroxytetrahydrobiopterin dehydratase [Deinobacterium chartae]|uniref:4a-hydroxytetrahydrobiopterin dehydratase n=1 Tax=Deinobacterium chartae TaxID=521158 RepID=A0A841I5X8_9DEIO|nr:4a-hydroxytetrahydrobiopterin dehydratase [Deinobacterium chartae]MBB6099275.1 4a-hydroxytetrahydrobiopterin dehydratase [Deinobacterium chartae]
MKLPAEQIEAALKDLPGWTGDETGISREFTFPSYEAGVAFAVQVALMAQRVNHHPDSLEIGWKRVRVRYVTHSAGGVTDKDLEAARGVEALVG